MVLCMEEENKININAGFDLYYLIDVLAGDVIFIEANSGAVDPQVSDHHQLMNIDLSFKSYNKEYGST